MRKLFTRLTAQRFTAQRLTVRETDLPRVERLLHPLLAGSTAAAIVISIVTTLALIAKPSWLDNAGGPVADRWMSFGTSLVLLATLIGLRKLSQRLPSP